MTWIIISNQNVSPELKSKIVTYYLNLSQISIFSPVIKRGFVLYSLSESNWFKKKAYYKTHTFILIVVFFMTLFWIF